MYKKTSKEYVIVKTICNSKHGRTLIIETPDIKINLSFEVLQVFDHNFLVFSN